MPKKSATARGGSSAQRNKPKTQKSFELVRSVSEEPALEENESTEPPATNVATVTATTPAARKEKAATPKVDVPEEKEEKESVISAKGSAAARLAARRQATQKAQQRSAASLISPEHFAYVRKDLIIIAALALIMFATIITLYFVLGAHS
jgi:hypothetical protein